MTVRGYMRISTVNEAQKFDRQEERLEELCDILYSERISGSKRNRPELDRLLEELEEGDTVVILSIDRLSRSTKDLLDIVEVIREKGATLKSLQDTWLDTTNDNPMSDFLLTIMGALAEVERKNTVKRVNEGIATAKRKGVKFGRPEAKKSRVDLALELYNKGEHTAKQIAEIAGISRATLYRKLKEQGAVVNG